MPISVHSWDHGIEHPCDRGVASSACGSRVGAGGSQGDGDGREAGLGGVRIYPGNVWGGHDLLRVFSKGEIKTDGGDCCLYLVVLDVAVGDGGCFRWRSGKRWERHCIGDRQVGEGAQPTRATARSIMTF